MTTKTALTELRKLVPKECQIRACVSQSDYGDGVASPSCEIVIVQLFGPQVNGDNTRLIVEQPFTGNCLEPCLQAASEWAMKEFGKK